MYGKNNFLKRRVYSLCKQWSCCLDELSVSTVTDLLPQPVAVILCTLQRYSWVFAIPTDRDFRGLDWCHQFYFYEQIINNTMKVFLKLNSISLIWLVKIISFVRWCMKVIWVLPEVNERFYLTFSSLYTLLHVSLLYYLFCNCIYKVLFVANLVLPGCIYISNISTCSGFPCWCPLLTTCISHCLLPAFFSSHHISDG